MRPWFKEESIDPISRERDVEISIILTLRSYVHYETYIGISLYHTLHSYIHYETYAVDLVIFACLNFCEFLILGLLTKFRIRKFSSVALL